MDDDGAVRGMRIFRGADALHESETEILRRDGLTRDEMLRLRSIAAAGDVPGAETRVLVNFPGFSLIHVWFKKEFPLPLHSHDADCLYYVIAGSLKLGTETLGPGDGMFVPADVPYGYTPGPDGVEVLEFRHATSVDIKLWAKGDAFWQKAVATVARNAGAWASARPPSEHAAA